ncbi:tetratricopeptide repeat protein [Streptomyces sp. NBC_00250]|uniref:tetratricopeptide repeat protein n=1 Tax=Streptomyces sp. NBC_00250 TaxID=2903641 RepID=UPI002E284A64|nr:tetratricopeptide repeat protein [Streptomyces sp. NBC_00250]
MSDRYDLEKADAAKADTAKRPEAKADAATNGQGPSDAVQQEARASGQGRINLAGRDQNITQIETQNVWGPGSGPAPRALASLPPAPRLTGREERTAELLTALAPDGAGVTVVTGLPGVGKTALALQAAHRAVDMGRFPGGTLFVPLRGYDPAGAVSPEQALESLLRALGVRDGDLPPTVEEQTGLYQSELARRAEERGPILIVADDASSPAQLRLLVPAHPRHRLLATSRDALTAPDLRARLLPLDELDTESATALIAIALAQVRPDDPRAAEDPHALEQVAGHCGRLPLALTIAAALLTDDPGLPIATLADDLADARTRLKTLQHEDSDGRSLAVQAAFDLSYRRLKARDARLFRRLSLNPGPDLSLKAATSLSGWKERETRTSLAALVRACLIGEQPTGSGRWRAHDLIRLYAAELPREAGEEAALERLLLHYAVTCDAADDHLRALPGQPVPDLFADQAAALTWLDAERANLIAVAPHTVANHPQGVLHLTLALGVYLRQGRHFHDALVVGEHSIWAAQALGDRKGEGSAANNLGNALQEVRRYDDAIHAYTQAVAIHRELGNRHGEGATVNNLGCALQEVRRYDDAIEAHTQAVAIHREQNDRRREGQSLSNLGNSFQQAQRYDEAIKTHTQALAICRELGDRHGEGATVNNLGCALQGVQRYDDAIAAHTQALAIHRELGNRYSAGQTLNNLGNALQGVQRYDDAIAAHTEDLAICRELGDRHGEGQTLGNLGNALLLARRYDDAIDAHTRAVAIFREFEDRHNEEKAQRSLDGTLLEARQKRRRPGWRRWFRRGGAGGPGA